VRLLALAACCGLSGCAIPAVLGTPAGLAMIGDGVTADGRAREYIYHMVSPRFVARVVAVDDDGLPEPEEEPADILSGIVYAANDETMLCEIEWIDDVDPGAVTHLLEAEADAIDRA
jgi:hypothetical protein